MNDLEQPPLLKGPPPRPALPAPDRDITTPTQRCRWPRQIRPQAARPRRSRAVYRRSRAGRMAALPAAPSGHGHRRTAGELRPERARRAGSPAARQAACDIARDDARFRGGQHLCARQRLCAEALCRYRRSRRGRAAPRRDHRARGRGPDCAISEQPAAGSRRRASRIKPSSRWPTSPGDATRCSSSKAG